MKSIIKVSALVFAVMILSSVLLSAQEHNHMHKSEKKHDDNKMKDISKIDKNNDGFIYECPMKCEPASDKAGECSKCGMKLKKVSVSDTDKAAKCSDKEKSCCGEKGTKCSKSEMKENHGNKKDHEKMNHDKKEHSKKEHNK